MHVGVLGVVRVRVIVNGAVGVRVHVGVRATAPRAAEAPDQVGESKAQQQPAGYTAANLFDVDQPRDRGSDGYAD
jgi:hypothetical protein